MINIEQLLSRGEGKTIEFKENLKSLKRIIKTAIAFSNTTGGIILIGIDDNRNEIGLTTDDSLLGEEKLANSISDSIVPQIIPEISYVNYNQKELLMVKIYPGNNRPYYLRNNKQENSVYVRVGSTNRIASPEMIQQLRRKKINISFDQEILYEADVNELDLKYISNLFKEKYTNIIQEHEIKDFDFTKNREGILQTLGIIKTDRGKTFPTNGGYILFGKQRKKYFPQAIVRCARFKGTNVDEFLDIQDFGGYPVSEIEKIMSFVKRNIKKSATISEIYREEKYEFPLLAVREALINAIVHRDYSIQGSDIKLAIYDNRIEMISPGMLPFGIDIYDIKSGVSHLRNKMIGRIFKELGLIEQWGTGIKRIYSECEKRSLKEPEFFETGNYFKVIIYNRTEEMVSEDFMYLNPDERKVLSAFQKRGKMVNADIADILGKSVRTARKVAKSLIESGYIIEVASNKYDPNKYYKLRD